METLIAVLPTHVIDQIAAGEVIERPASVVKELTDNAIDAGARSITVETQGGGRARILVVDDGHGMSPRDAVLAFERHATSKLRAVDDLWDLSTMGFRGEALPSIASVARVTLTTRRAQDLAATRVQMEGGRLVGVTEVGAPVGTSVEVTDLLYNVPARLKFLKGETTEATHVTDLIARLAMAHPQLHLRLRHNGRVALDTPPDLDGFARAQALLGPRIAARMVQVSGEEAGIRVVAYLGAPELAQTTARGVQLFVGRRAIRDRGVLHALAMGYGELVPRGRYPLAVVLLDAPAGAVDFNVHPQKHEVRFADPSAVASAVRHVVQAGIARAPWRDEIGGAGPVMMTAIASVAPPRLPLDASATNLAQTYATQLREAREQPQRALAFDGGPRAWAQQIQDRVRSARAAEAEAAARDAAAHARLDRARRDLAAASDDVRSSTGAPGHAQRALAIDGAAAGGAAAGGAHDLGEGGRSPRALAMGGAAWGDANDLGEGGGDSRALGLGGAASGTAHDQREGSGDRRALAMGGAAAGGAHDLLEGGGDPRTLAIGGTATGGAGASPDGFARSLAAQSRDAVPWDGAQLAEGSHASTAPGFFSSLRYVGQLDLTYLLCEGDGELVLIDQHVAHERVELARLKAGQGDRGVATQRLLFPTTIEVKPAHVELATRLAGVLAQVGYEAEAFGATSLAVKAVPGGIRHGDPTQLLKKLLAAWAEEGAPSEAERLEQVLAEIACHSVVRAGDRLSPSEAEALLRSMDTADFSGRGPHNRPVMLRMSLADIARRFGR